VLLLLLLLLLLLVLVLLDRLAYAHHMVWLVVHSELLLLLLLLLLLPTLALALFLPAGAGATRTRPLDIDERCGEVVWGCLWDVHLVATCGTAWLGRSWYRNIAERW
jgi:hypothetical protein